jgi:ribosome-associated protein
MKAAKAFAIEAARLAANTRCHSVVVLDVTGISPVCDYFVIATGTSARQMKSVGDELLDLAVQKDFAPLRKPGLDSETWILVDCVDVIIHLFSEDARHYYDLDNLWGDAKQVEWQDRKSGK